MANRRIGYICTILVVYVLRETILRVIYSLKILRLCHACAMPVHCSDGALTGVGSIPAGGPYS
jgi:hypothetical protein